MKLSEKYPRAIVTGASRGLGQAFCEMLLEEGVEVWGTARDPATIFKHPRMHACALDLNEPHSIALFLEQAVRECPDVALLINNAGNGTLSRFEHFPVGEITRQMDVLLTGPIRLCRAFYPLLMQREYGAIVNVASLASEFPLPMMPLYNASKAGLSHFTKTLQLENPSRGLCILDFQPGDFCTDFNTAMMKDPTRFDETTQRVWQSLEKHLKSAPAPEHAAKDLKRALARGKSGVVRTGSFFQASFAPMAARFASTGVVRWVLKTYYRM